MLTNQELAEQTGLDIVDFVKKGATDFKFWAETLFPKIKIMSFHLRWVDLFYTNERACIIAFRGSGKSTILGVFFMLWISFYHKDKNMLIVSHSMRDSTKLIREMRKHINTVELLNNRLSPKNRNYTWTKTEINTATGCRILCKPYSDQARSEHVDYMLLDEASDFVDLTIYESVLLPMVLRYKGHIMTIGTPKTEIDLLAKLKEPDSRYLVEEYPAENDKGELLWEKVFPQKELNKIRKDQGEIAYAREYLLTLRGSGTQAISNEAIIQSFDDNLSLISKKSDEEDKHYFMGCDLALSPDGDYSVFTVVERTPDKKIIIRNIERVRGMDPESQARIISDLYLRFKPLVLYVDESVFGKSLIIRLQTEYHVPARSCKFDSYTRNSIIGNVVGIFNHPDGSRIVIPRNMNDAKTSMLTNELWKELTAVYPGVTKTGLDTYKTVSAHDDMLMSLGMACRAAEEMISSHLHIRSY